MGDLFSIAASGVAAARSALTVTGENIANVDTQGYRRRDTIQAEIAGAETSPFLKGITQQGVQVTDIRRAFDGLLAARTRDAGGALAAATATAPYLEQLETRLMADGGGPLPQVEAFFDATANLAAAPEDMGLRLVTVQAGQALASGVADLALGVQDLRGAVSQDSDAAIAAANRLITDLAAVQDSMALQKGAGARNPLLDRRDAMLADLAGLVDISVTLSPGGVAEVRLGRQPGGPILVSGGQGGHLSQGGPGRLVAQPPDPGGAPQSRAITGGSFGGLAAADAAMAELATRIDDWAGKIARDLNAVHGASLDLAGAPGGALVSLAGWRAEALAANRGNVAALVSVTDPAAMPQGPLELVHDAGAGLWRAQGPGGVVLAEGSARLSLPGLVIDLDGTAVDGDRIALTDTSGWAGHMRWLISDGADLAMADAITAAGLATNRATTEIRAVMVPPPPAPGPDLSVLLGAQGPIDFLAEGVVGRLPAGSGGALLQALPRDAAQEFALGAGAMLQGLTLGAPGADAVFTAPAPLTADDFATGLANGTIRSATGQSLSDLGLTLASGPGGLTLAAAEGAVLPMATLATSGGAVAGVIVADAAPAATLSVFTREGRQIAGPPISAHQAQALLTEANGFLPGATYGVATGLVSQARLSGTGDATLTLGMAQGIAGFTGAGPVPPVPASAITLDGAALSAAIDLPEGTSAARRAEIIADTVPLAVRAQTGLGLTLPETGRVSFTLTGDGLTPRAFAADLTTGGPGALAQAINAQSVMTGITAELSPDGGRLVLAHAGGADIVLGQVRHDGGGTLGVTRLGPDGVALGAAVALGGAGPDGARISGTVTLTSPGDLAASEDGLLRQALPDGFAGGPIARSLSQAGGVQDLRFAGSGLAPGLTIATPDGRDITVPPDPGFAALTGQEQAGAVLAALRADAPASRLTGAPLAVPPPLGAVLTLDLGGDAYAIRMTESGMVIEGPEPGRISAAFDATGRLVVQTLGGDLDGAALRLPPDASEAARFGLGVADAPRTRLLGAVPTELPASFGIEIGAMRHDVTVTAGGVTLPPGFPGSAAIDAATGAVMFDIDARAGAIRIPSDAGAADAGFVTLSVKAGLAGDTLRLTATDGRRLDTRALSSGSAQSLALDSLPDEDLLVVMTGPGALRLGGAVGPVADPVMLPRELRVIDAATGQVGLYDAATGIEIATRTLDANGSATLGGYSVTLTGGLADGDRFSLMPNTGGQGDGRGAERLTDLARRDTTTDRGGFAALYAEILGGVGAQVAAADLRLGTATTQKESADTAEAKLSGVDLDTEAARLLQQQQAYQANAQVLNIARQLFDTLLNAL